MSGEGQEMDSSALGNETATWTWELPGRNCVRVRILLCSMKVRCWRIEGWSVEYGG